MPPIPNKILAENTLKLVKNLRKMKAEATLNKELQGEK